MFASNSSNDINPLPYPNSMEGDDFDYPPPSSYDLHFPDPFLDDHDLFFSHFLSSQQQQQQFIVGDAWEDYHDNHHQTSNNTTVVNTITNNKNNNSKNKIKNNKTKSLEVTVATTTAAVVGNGNVNGNGKKRNMISRKNPKNRTGKKDRHSKICTAQGPRDRRMRLSLQIARKFFDLQDMLGFDKASKTIEWLISNSNSAIKELKENNKSYSSYGYGSVISSGSSSVLSEINNNISKRRELKFCSKEEADKKSRKLCTVGRESRDRARARARERTKEKLILKGLQNSKSNPTISLHQDFPGNGELQNPNPLSLLCSNSSVFSDPKPYIF